MELPDNGERGRLAREYDECKEEEETRPHREAEEYRKFLKEPDEKSEDTEIPQARDEGVTGLDNNLEDTETADKDHEEVTQLDGDLRLLFEKGKRAIDREMKILLEEKRAERKKELIKNAQVGTRKLRSM